MSCLESFNRLSNYDNDVYTADEPFQIKERMYRTKLANLKLQMQQLKDGVHPDYVRQLKKIEDDYDDRLKLIKILTDHLLKIAENDYECDRQAALREFDEKKLDLKDTLLNDLEERRRLIEIERNTLELNSDVTEAKTAMSRKLRRRANDPLPMPDKRRKAVSANFINLLDDKEIEADFKSLLVKPSSTAAAAAAAANATLAATVVRRAPRKFYPNEYEASAMIMSSCENFDGPMLDVRIEDGKLIYEKRWYHRGQPVFVEGKDIGKCAANIIQINPEAILLKKVDGNKIRVLVPHLKYGMVTLKRRVP